MSGQRWYRRPLPTPEGIAQMTLTVHNKPDIGTVAGPFRIVITMVRPDATTVADTEAPAWYRGEVARDEQQQPEQVVTTIALHETCDQASALRHAQAITDTIPAADRAAYRIKVVPA